MTRESGRDDAQLASFADAGLPIEAARLLADALGRLRAARRTFTEEDALRQVWEAGYDIAAHPDLGFVLAREADGRHERQWMLSTQALANDRLLDKLQAGSWDGDNLDAELARLDAEDGVHYVFCPIDERLATRSDGKLEPAQREDDLPVPPAARAELDALATALLARWREVGSEPWTVRQIVATLGDLGWPGTDGRQDWLVARAWLRARPDVRRVGQDYWVLADALPPEPARRRLGVLSVTPSSSRPSLRPPESAPDAAVSPGAAQGDASSAPASQAPLGVEPAMRDVAWTVPLRTFHLVDGVVPVPPAARGAYPPRAPGVGNDTVVRGLWYDTGERFWLWLDRGRDLLHGQQLADRLGWCEAGNLLRIDWSPEGVVMRLAGHDDAIQLEETRLVDVEALADLRGGLGESYRQSLQVILVSAPEGLTFPEVVAELRERQGHAIHRGTVRALLHAGGFAQHLGRWVAADAAVGARRLRAALVAALPGAEAPGDAAERGTPADERPSARAAAIRQRLARLADTLRAPG